MNLANFSSSARHNCVLLNVHNIGKHHFNAFKTVVLSVLISGKLPEFDYIMRIPYSIVCQLSASIFIAIVLSFRMVGLPSWLLVKVIILEW